MNYPYMPKSTALWLIENTALTFEQIAEFCGLHELEVKNIIHLQRKYFLTGETLNVDFRIQALKKLKDCIIKYENKISDALKKDLGKSFVA